jgi:hypothetical protein
MTEPRKLLSRWRTAVSNEAVYQTADGLEVESNQQYEVVERRVLFDDVLLVTLHRHIGVAYPLVTGVIAAFFIGIGIVILSVNVDAWAAAAIFGGIGAPFLLALLLRVMFAVDVITVFGRRSKAILRFGLRKKRAREVYGQVCAAVRNAQRVPPSS